MRYLKPGGVSIPSRYVSTIAPLSSSRLWNEVRGLKELKHFETQYVVKMHNCWQMGELHTACLTEPRRALAASWPCSHGFFGSPCSVM